MTVLGKFKRIARRPSLLLKGSSHKTCATSGSDSYSEGHDSFENTPRKQTEKLDIHFAPPSSAMYGYEPSDPRPCNAGRRASTGNGVVQSMSSDYNPAAMGLTKEQVGRIQRAKNRRRNSLTMVSSSEHGTYPTMMAKIEFEPSQRLRAQYEEASPAWKRRHSLDYGKKTEQPPTPLYTIRPDSSSIPKKPACRRNSLTKSNNQGLSQGSWHNVGSTRSVRSAETIRSAGTQHSTRSNGTQQSAGSTFSSTGWSVATTPESPRKKPSNKLNLQHVTAHGGAGGIGSRLYTIGRGDSTKSLDSLDSEASFGE